MEKPVAIDAMGGDFAPASPVAGAVEAAREFSIPILLVGRQNEIEAELGRQPDTSGLSIDIVNATEVVGMAESPVTAFRRKKDSSIRIGATLIRDGRAQGLVTAGNTGAAMTSVKMICGVLEGVERPALCAVVPNLHGLVSVARRRCQHRLPSGAPRTVRHHGPPVRPGSARRWKNPASA